MKSPLPLLVAFLFLFLETAPAQIHHAQGEMAGEVTASTVLLQSRLTAIPGPELDGEGDVPGAAGVAYFEWSTSEDFNGAKRSEWMEARADNDFLVRT